MHLLLLPQELNEETKENLAGILGPEVVLPGHTLCEAGDPADCLWILQSGAGSAWLHMAHEGVLSCLPAARCCGWTQNIEQSDGNDKSDSILLYRSPGDVCEGHQHQEAPLGASHCWRGGHHEQGDARAVHQASFCFAAREKHAMMSCTRQTYTVSRISPPLKCRWRSTSCTILCSGIYIASPVPGTQEPSFIFRR